MAVNLSQSFSPSTANLSDENDRILRRTIETLIALRLEEVDEEWVQDIWESQVRPLSFPARSYLIDQGYLYYSLLNAKTLMRILTICTMETTF